MTITRAEYNNLVDDLIKRTIQPCKDSLKDAEVTTKDINQVILVGGMSRTPKVIETVKNFYGKEPFKGVNPDEAVAMGAAIQSAVLQGKINDVLLLDVTPLSLGIETLGGVFTRLIPRNTTIPTKKSKTFSTAADNQTEVDIKVLQGEREMADDNKLLGQFKLGGIPPAPKGIPQIDVTFDIDANGIVHVSAKEKTTNKEADISITSSGGLSDSDIERMVKEAELNREADKKRKEASEKKNHAQGIIYDCRKGMDEYKDFISQEDKDNLNKMIGELEAVLETASPEELKEKADEIQKVQLKAFEQGYKEKAKQNQDNSSTNNENVNEAEYKDVDDSDKKDK